jgi:hypothetical protein
MLRSACGPGTLAAIFDEGLAVFFLLVGRECTHTQ